MFTHRRHAEARHSEVAGLGAPPLPVQNSLARGVTVGHFALRKDQNARHHPDHQGQVEQVYGDAEARQPQRGADGGDAPRPDQEQQEQRVMQGTEDQSRDGQDEPQQRGRQPGVQRQRGQQQPRSRPARGHGLGGGKRTPRQRR
ncbi:hypothetical protein EYF80_010899 [Liparis tanakae]|uniref:Uncharacterized protein n=1 Tax=Liparis tanakae TaxID=230148 RepID=A0A4Z2IL24_9TELE|nr:hypothetical protein EYF80_010899 [Liparis tanakae]